MPCRKGEIAMLNNNYSFKSDIYYCTLSLVLHITWDGNRGLMLKLAVEG